MASPVAAGWRLSHASESAQLKQSCSAAHERLNENSDASAAAHLRHVAAWQWLFNGANVAAEINGQCHQRRIWRNESENGGGNG
jgi:hypothetical protein